MNLNQNQEVDHFHCLCGESNMGSTNSEQEKKQTLLNRKFKMRDDIGQEILIRLK